MRGKARASMFRANSSVPAPNSIGTNENPRPLRCLIFRGSIPHPMQSLCTLRLHVMGLPRLGVSTSHEGAAHVAFERREVAIPP